MCSHLHSNRCAVECRFCKFGFLYWIKKLSKMSFFFCSAQLDLSPYPDSCPAYLEPGWSKLMLADYLKQRCPWKVFQHALESSSHDTRPPEGSPLDSNSCRSCGTPISLSSSQLFVVPKSVVTHTLWLTENQMCIFHAGIGNVLHNLDGNSSLHLHNKWHAINAKQIILGIIYFLDPFHPNHGFFWCATLMHQVLW